ncbi:FAD-binding oxidoreductase [Blastochloris viridis]|uniref:D-lactate dehydrogenase (cytochrome) n=1 Tax=Blastochloris viridis TaxID=1079 RepID=A0A0H5BJT2_BLAVI|nr:FAD-linked oxidase C-terminal domain-containing protein [Blastochloris viridis]ALK09364.1 putative FAD-linked oxidoreductase [Blastochloris viridis]BAS00757.1 D-Lactate dehydrogenase [Blastochloris viridis]CUU42027.1 putative FAD-linked oxidoreductase [Blastochloris viridis]
MNRPFPHAEIGAAVAALQARLGERAVTSDAVRDHHARDESSHAARKPDIVVFPEATHEVAEIARIASAFQVPIVPFGAGSGLEGAAIPVFGGISLDTSRLDAILEIRADDMIARVQAGVRRQALNHHLRDTGLFFPVDPGADASIGGMVATGASGTNAVRFGVMRENVLGLTVVLVDGRVIRTGGLARKSSAGYDLTRLFVGSEGTLGIVTEVTLRLHPIPDAVSATAGFMTLYGAVAAVVDIKRAGIAIGRVELLDEATVAVIGRRSSLELDPLPTLFFEFHGDAAEVAVLSNTVSEIIAENGGTNLRWLREDAAARALWDARRLAPSWLKAERLGAVSRPSDVCVPVSSLADLVAETRADVAASPVPAYMFGHVGDGNFHCLFVYHPNDPAEEAEAARLGDRIVARALAAGGTATGEHGVGLGKRRWLEREHGSEAVAVMQALKFTLDPLGLLNPGKVLPEPTTLAWPDQLASSF